MPYSTREKKNAHAREYARGRAETRNAYMRRWRKINCPLIKDKAYAKLGNRCSSPTCRWINFDGTRGCSERACLQLDHVFGKGRKERQLTTSYIIYQRVLTDTEGRYQLLCANCNWIKRNSEVERPVY